MWAACSLGLEEGEVPQGTERMTLREEEGWPGWGGWAAQEERCGGGA